MDIPVSKWKLWVDIIIGWLLIAAVVLFIKVAVPHLRQQALRNDPGVPAGVQWTALGSIWGGDIRALASSADGQLYAGTASGAIYRSLDDGMSWNLLCRTESGSGVTALTATSGPMTVVVRTAGRGGLQVSYDDGHTWQQSGRVFSDDTVTALVQAGDGDALYVATANHGIYVSDDVGRHWRKANTGLPTLNISCLLATPPGDDRLFAGTYDQGVVVAHAADLAWSSSNGLPKDSSVTALAWDASWPDTVVAVLHKEDVYVSMDAGRNWSALAGLPSETGTVSAIIIAPQPSWHLVVATSKGSIYAAADPFKGWKSVSPAMCGLAVHALCRSASTTLMVGTSGGVFSADTASWQWTDASMGIQEVQVTCLASDPIRQSLLYAGTTGGMYVSSDSGSTWRRTALDLASQDIAVIRAGTPLLVGTRRAGLWASADGNRWRRIAAKQLSDDVLALMPGADATGSVLTGTSLGVWQVDLASGRATERNLGLRPRGADPDPQNYVEVTAFGVDPVDSQHIFCLVVGGGLRESNNGGVLWKRVEILDKPMLGSSADLEWLSSIHVDAMGTVRVGSVARGIWTGMPGDAWKPQNKGLSRLGVYCGSVCALAMDAAQRLYAATTRGGIFVLVPGEVRWFRMNLGLASLGGQALTVGPDATTLYCAMDGVVYTNKLP